MSTFSEPDCTIEHGGQTMIYGFYANEVGNSADIATPGSTLNLNSVNTQMGRRWHILGDKGIICWKASATETLDLCSEWLARNGYKPLGDLPPDVFEYKKP